MFRHVYMHKRTSICTKHLIFHAYLMHMHSIFILCIMHQFYHALQCISISVLIKLFDCYCRWLSLNSCRTLLPVHCHFAQLCTTGPYSTPASQALLGHSAFPATRSTSVVISQLLPLCKEILSQHLLGYNS
jgi:hypothetical protein